MESPQNLKKRLKSVNNIGQITKAMELVSATKMRKSQQLALDSRPYAFVSMDLLANLSVLVPTSTSLTSWIRDGEAIGKKELPELLKARKKIKKVLFVLVASDKGLAGAFNSSLFRKFEKFILENKEYRETEKLFVAVGEKTFNYLSRKFTRSNSAEGGPAKQDLTGDLIVKKFVNVGDFTTPEQVKPLVDFLIEGYLRGGEKKWPVSNASRSQRDAGWDSVIVFSTHFRSALKQEPLMRKILPIDFKSIENTIKEIIPERGKFADFIKENQISFISEKSKIQEYIIEPSPKKVLEDLVRHLFFMQVYHLILEANASEHSARRLAMKTASDNALELASELTLQYNKSRQAGITKEIIEITAGAEALS